MRQRQIAGVIVSMMWLLTSCFAHHMAVIVEKGNKVQNVSSSHLAKMVKGDVKTWPDGKGVVFVVQTNSPDTIGTLARVARMTKAEMSATIQQNKDRFRTEGSDADVIDAVASMPGAIGLVEERSINDRVNVIKVDGKLPMEAGYLPH